MRQVTLRATLNPLILAAIIGLTGWPFSENIPSAPY